MNDVTLHDLIRQLSEGDPDEREDAAYELNKLRNLHVFDAFVVALDDDYYIVRGTVADALAELGDLRAIEPLIARLQIEQEESSRHMIMGALAQLKAARALPYFRAALEADLTDCSPLEALIYFRDDLESVGLLTRALDLAKKMKITTLLWRLVVRFLNGAFQKSK